MVKRLFDIAIVLVSLPVVLPVAAGVALAILICDGRPVLYWSDRVGRGHTLFRMPKFRTMHRNTPAVATHLLPAPEAVLIPVGRLLRTTSLDEIPQLWSVLRGDMSVVGPRPALFNQEDLITLRTKYGIDQLVPGVTGWAQINGRDELSVPRKVDLDREYLQRKTFAFDIRIIFLTVARVIGRKGISH